MTGQLDYKHSPLNQFAQSTAHMMTHSSKSLHHVRELFMSLLQSNYESLSMEFTTSSPVNQSPEANKFRRFYSDFFVVVKHQHNEQIRKFINDLDFNSAGYLQLYGFLISETANGMITPEDATEMLRQFETMCEDLAL